MKKYFEILGLDEKASRAEIEEAYGALKQRYSEDRFKEGEEGNEASRRLMELEEAYAEVSEALAQPTVVIEDTGVAAEYAAIDALIKENRLEEAQAALDNMSQRLPEWHYLQAIIFYKRGWYGECRTQLRIALNLSPHHPKYKTAAEKLELFLGNIRTENNMGPNPNAAGIYSEGFDPRRNNACNNSLCCLPSICCCSNYLCGLC